MKRQLTKEQREKRHEKIRRVYEETGNQRETARRCDVSPGTVRYVIVPGEQEQATKRSRTYRKDNPEHRRNHYNDNKEIVAEQGKAYRQANPKKVAEKGRNWRKANPKRSAEHFHKYRKANPEKCSEACRKWRKANPEKIAEYGRAYRKANPETAAANCARRKARKLNALIFRPGTPEHDRLDWIEVAARQGGKGIGDFLGLQLELDHITPLKGSLVECSGLHVVENFQLLEKGVNISKHNRRIAVCPVGKKVVDYFVDIYDTAKQDITVPPVFQATEIGPLLDYLGDHTISQLIKELSTLKEFTQDPDTSSSPVVECSVRTIPKQAH